MFKKIVVLLLMMILLCLTITGFVTTSIDITKLQYQQVMMYNTENIPWPPPDDGG